MAYTVQQLRSEPAVKETGEIYLLPGKECNINKFVAINKSLLLVRRPSLLFNFAMCDTLI